MSNVLHTVQSRLKHRKVLGVGESADGKFPRSKICQLLGNDHINHIVIARGGYPRGLRLFQWLTCLLFGVIGAINVFSPQHFYRSVTPCMMDPNSLVRQVATDLRKIDFLEKDVIQTNEKTKADSRHQLEEHFENLEKSLDMLEVPVRLYGTACLSLSALFFIVAVINKDNRRAIRIALCVEAMYFVVDILVTIFTINPLSTQNTSWLTDPASIFWLTMYKVIGLLLCIYYGFVTHPSRDNSHRD